MTEPLVSIICLCFNHRSFLEEAIDSVLKQTYPHLQIIIVDDASTDGSRALIEEIGIRHSKIQTRLLSDNSGNCKAFNQGLKLASGEFIIDFSTDDIMMPDRIEKQVAFFKQQDERVGVVFTDAVYIDHMGISFRDHFAHLLKRKLIKKIPSGDVFRSILTSYFICSPTMMIRKNVLEALHGYDEELAYEDFDFWVRASRNFWFAFLNEKLTKVRRSSGSMSTGWYQQGDKQLHSTYLICKKAVTLCRDDEDRKALKWRVLYEFRQAVFSENKPEAELFRQLLVSLGGLPFSFYIIKLTSFIPLPWALLRKKYHQLLFG